MGDSQPGSVIQYAMIMISGEWSMSLTGYFRPAKRSLFPVRRCQKQISFSRRNTTMNMTEGKPLALLSVFALPLLIGNRFQQAYILADSMIVGRQLGANALAAAGRDRCGRLVRLDHRRCHLASRRPFMPASLLPLEKEN